MPPHFLDGQPHAHPDRPKRVRLPGEPLRIGIGGPVGSGKTALVAALLDSAFIWSRSAPTSWSWPWARRQASMPPWMWQAAAMPTSCAACTAMAERSPKAQ